MVLPRGIASGLCPSSMDSAFSVRTMSRSSGGMAAAAFVAIFALHVPFPYIVLAAGIIGFIGGRIAPSGFRAGGGHGTSDASFGPALIDDHTPVPDWARFSWRSTVTHVVSGLLIWTLLEGMLYLSYGWQGPLIVAAVIGLICVSAALAYGALERIASRKYGLGQAGETDKFQFQDIFRFSRSFWFVVLLCVTFYSAIFPFRSFSIKYFIEAWDLTRDVAGQFNSVLPLAAMIATPIFGLLCDKVGKRALFMIFGAITLMPVYLMMAYHLTPLWVPIVMMGIAFSLIPAVMWPSVAYIVEERRLGTAYSVMTLIQQIGVAGMNWAIGRRNDAFGASAANPMGYAPGMWIFSILGFLALFFAIMTGLYARSLGPVGRLLADRREQISETLGSAR